MNHHLRLVHIHFCLWICFQNFFSDCRINLHGSHRIILAGTSGIHFKRKILVRIYPVHIGNHFLCKLVKALILQKHNRADSDNSEHSLQCFHSLVKVILSLCVHIDTSVLLADMKVSFYVFKLILNIVYQCILKKVPVLSFDCNLCIFNQKRLIHTVLLNVLYIFEASESMPPSH